MDGQQLPGMPLPVAAAGHPHRRRPRGRGARRPDPAVGVPRRRLEMRDLTICALTEGSRFQGKTVAAAFGIQPSQVSRIRSRYREHGARGLVHQMGRPPILSPARLRQARTWAGQGLTHAEIGRKLGVSRSRITELIKQHGTLLAPEPLFDDTEDTGTGPAGHDGEGTAPGQRAGTTRRRRPDTGGGDAPAPGRTTPAESRTAGGDGEGAGTGWQVARRIESGTVACRYAGAMLVHAFTSRIDAQGLLRAGTGAASGGRRCRGRGGRPGHPGVHPDVVHPRRADDGADQAPYRCRRRSAGRTDVPAVAADLAAAAGRAGRRVRPAGAAAPAGQPDARHRARRIAGVPGR